MGDAAMELAPQLPQLSNRNVVLPPPVESSKPAAPPIARSVSFSLADLHEALELVRLMDPPGVACRDLRECLMYQLRYHQQQLALHKNGTARPRP